MTAIPHRHIVGDAELARAAATGDRAAFADIYDRYADRLHDFCIGMLRDRDAAADCVQDTFCTAATRLPQLRDPDRLRPWLYAIARNEALRRLRDRRREQPAEYLPDTASTEPGPDTLAVRTELADLIAEATGGLSDRDRAVLELTYRHGLDGPELAESLGVGEASARTLAHRMRKTVERSLGALLLARGVRAGRGCPDLAAMLTDWDGRFTILIRKRIARHIDSCPTCEDDRRRRVNPVALLGGTAVFIPAPHWLRAPTLGRIQLTSAGTPLGSTGTEGSGPDALISATAGAPTPRGSDHPPAPTAGASSQPAGIDTTAGLTGNPPHTASSIAGSPSAATKHDFAAEVKKHAVGSAEQADGRRRRRPILLLMLGFGAVLAAAGIGVTALLTPQNVTVAPSGVTDTAHPRPTGPTMTPQTMTLPTIPPSPIIAAPLPAASITPIASPPTHERPRVQHTAEPDGTAAAPPPTPSSSSTTVAVTTVQRPTVTATVVAPPTVPVHHGSKPPAPAAPAPRPVT